MVRGCIEWHGGSPSLCKEAMARRAAFAQAVAGAPRHQPQETWKPRAFANGFLLRNKGWPTGC
nr:hypothetical protein [Luteibacter sp. 9135]